MAKDKGDDGWRWQQLVCPQARGKTQASLEFIGKMQFLTKNEQERPT